MDKIICHPALVYLIISLIILCIAVILRLNTTDLAVSFSQLSYVILCTLILMGLCSIAPQISWVVTTIFIILTICIVIAIIMNWISPPLI